MTGRSVAVEVAEPDPMVVVDPVGVAEPERLLVVGAVAVLLTLVMSAVKALVRSAWPVISAR